MKAVIYGRNQFEKAFPLVAAMAKPPFELGRAMMVEENVPVIVGVGQFVERLDDPDYKGISSADIAAAASRAALEDSGAAAAVAPRIAVVGGIRTFEDSSPRPTPFGKPDKYTLAVARRLGLAPKIAILEAAGGNSPLSLLEDVAERIRAGATEAALIFGSEAISSTRHLAKIAKSATGRRPTKARRKTTAAASRG